MTPTVSVILPVYNSDIFLREAIESILSQTYSDFEVIAIDDGSTDATSTILRKYVKIDSRLHIYTQLENRGLVEALNQGLKLAQGKYIARMDADDISLTNRLEKQVDFLENHPEIGVLGTGVEVIDSLGQHQGTMNYSLVHPLILWELCFHCPIIHPTVMIRHDVLDAVGGYQSVYPCAEDYDLWTRLSEFTQFANLPESLLRLRKHGANVTIKNQSMHLESSAAISQNMIFSISRCQVSVTPLELAWKPRRIPPFELQQLLQAIDALLNHLLDLPDLTLDEKRFLRSNAALQLSRLLRNSALDITFLKVFWQAFKCDPLFGGQILRLMVDRVSKRFLGR